MKNTKKAVLSSLCASLGVVCLYLGVLINVMDMTAALLASFLVLFCLMEMGYGYAFAVYAMISVLSLILLPNASPAWMFILLFGYIPISKFGFERIFKTFAWLPKLFLFNAFYAAMIFLGGSLLGFTTENQFGIPPYAVYTAFFVFGNLLYLLCDILYARLVRFYIVKIRDKIRKYLK
ncbi:MAG: hypothetical protein IJA86_08815 [Clostridia bacterium]|nr:hypothetical protein [Clostridia bacterium]